MPVLFRFLLALLLLALAVHAQDSAPTTPSASALPAATSAPIATVPPAIAEPPPWEPRLVETLLEAQIELHRRGFSCGSIDDVMGLQTAAALRAFQADTGQPWEDVVAGFVSAAGPPITPVPAHAGIYRSLLPAYRELERRALIAL